MLRSGARPARSGRRLATSGTANGPAVYTTGTNWTETGITWATRPAVTSAGAVLTVYSPLAITVQPASQNVGAGSNFTVSVTATGYPVPIYRWRKDGSDLPGASAPSYTVTGAQPAAAGDYLVVLTNILGVVTSSVAKIGVLYYVPTITGSTGFTGDQFGFGVSGPDGNSFVVESSTNLASWQAITTNTFGPGTFPFLDPASRTNPLSYYRVRSP